MVDSPSNVVPINQNEDEDFLTAEDILAVQDIETYTIEPPGWMTKAGKQGKMRLRMMTAKELGLYTDAVGGAQKRIAMVEIMRRSAVKKDGTPLFPNKDVIEQLLQKSTKAYVFIQEEILRINGINRTGQDAAKNG